MSPIKNVAVIGGSGNLGKEVVKSLLNSGFNVTALTREGSQATFPDAVHIYKTTYDSDSSLAAAFKDQDAVVSVIATAALGSQLKIIDAAAKAGVKRFIPSEFGVNIPRLKEGGIKKILGAKIQARHLLEKLAEEDRRFTWTGVSTNLFFDWGIPHGSFGLNPSTKTATIYDSGNESFTATNLPTIGLAIVSILQNPDETANKYLDIASFRTTQNELLKIAEEITGEKWTAERKITDGIEELADEKLAKGDYSAFGDYLRVFEFRDGEGQSPGDGELANGVLGLEREDVRESLKRVIV